MTIKMDTGFSCFPSEALSTQNTPLSGMRDCPTRRSLGTYALLATYTSLSTSMAMFYASGITIVIAVVVLLIAEAMVRNQSRDAADDVLHVQ